jgi:trans-aconitate methyltransferase
MSVKTTIRDDTGARHRRKYENRNWIHQLALGRFLDATAMELREIVSSRHMRALDFGCGEGLFLQELKRRSVRFDDLLGIDLREDALDDARAMLPEYRFEKADLMAWDKPEGCFDLVIASQVLEHLPDPDAFLKRLVHLTGDLLFLTVPWEPWFRISNLARGRDVRRLGNHPEHINLWNVASFRRFVSRHAAIEKMYTVFPFIIAIAKRPDRA